jgi:hypothetical protein
MNNILQENEEHGHEEHGHEEVVTTVEVHEHGDGLDGLFEVMFGFEHVVAEFFWNAIFLIAGFAISRFIGWQKIHKYIDDRHGVKHNKDEY